MNESLIEAIQQATLQTDTLPNLAQHTQHFDQLSNEETTKLLSQIVELTELDELEAHREPLDRAIQAVFQALVQWRHHQAKIEGFDQAEWQTSLENLYLWAAPDSNLRNLVLSWLSFSGIGENSYPRALERWTDFVCTNPPENRSGMQFAFGALMHRGWDPPREMLERLLKEAIAHSQIAPAVFDMFNFYYRSEMLAQHPAESRAEELSLLIERLAGLLSEIEDGTVKDKDPIQIGRRVSDSVALLVALCDTVSLIKFQGAVPALQKAFKLRHRRVQTESAAALASLGAPGGKEALIKLAEEPVCRLRVLAFAEELGIENEISLELRGEIACAESELAIWLAEPDNVGVAPTSVQLVDNREMYWPSYENPVQCYLFRYKYGPDETGVENIGIAGPLTYAFPADLTNLSVDDAYSLFAGWQTVHPDIFLIAVDKTEQSFPNDWMRVMRRMEEEELTDKIIQTAASFFGQLVAIVNCHWTDNGEVQSGTAIIDQEDVTLIPMGSESAPIDWELAFCLWRGRQLLATFNSTN